MVANLLRRDGAARLLKLKSENFAFPITERVADGSYCCHVSCLSWWIAKREHVCGFMSGPARPGLWLQWKIAGGHGSNRTFKWQAMIDASTGVPQLFVLTRSPHWFDGLPYRYVVKGSVSAKWYCHPTDGNEMASPRS